MKHILCVWLLLAGLFSACQAVTFADDDSVSSGSCKLTVQTRSVTNQNLANVHLLVFNSDGSYVSSHCLDSLTSSWKLSLPAGDYQLQVWAGWNDLSISDTPSLQDRVTLPNSNCLKTPLYAGRADVNLTQSKQQVSIMLTNQMACVTFQLDDVPSDITSVVLNLASPANQFQLNGKILSPQSTAIECRKQGDSWVSDPVFVLPTIEDQTVISISLKHAETTDTYSYTYNKGINSNVPYNFMGRYQDGINLQGTFQVKDWGTTITNTFSFGPGASNSADSSIEEFYVSDFPAVCSFWNGHLVALSVQEEDTADVLLLSLLEWENINSAYNAEDSLQAKYLARFYQENELGGWQLPSKEQAALLKIASDGMLDAINNQLNSVSAAPITLQDAGGKSVRYLCDDAKSTFVFSASSSFAKAGAKTTYRLRLVKPVKFRLVTNP